MKLKSLTTLVVLAAIMAAPSYADDHEVTGYLAEFLNDFNRASDKLMKLAEAMPEDAYGWRPTQEVRSFSESYMHVAGSNFYFARDLGVPLPEDLPEDLEKTVTAKAEVMAMLEKSVDHVRQAVAKSADGLDREIELFGRQRTVRSIFMILAGHSHEHLGQAITYARSYGVVPPWSRPS